MSVCRIACLMSVVIFAANAAARGQSIRSEISNTEAYLDEVLTLRVHIENPSQAGAPIVPMSKDFDIRLRTGLGNPASSVQQFFINGRYSRKATYTYTYDVTPRRVGSLTIPTIWLKDGGKQYKAAPIRVLVKRQSSGPRLLFCKVVVERKTAYVGEPVRLKLEAWVRKFRQRGFGTLGVQDMIGFFNSGASNFGIFKDSITGSTSYREDRRKDDEGLTNQYFVFFWEVTFYPKSVGPFDFGDIFVAWQYPVRLARTPFGRRTVGSNRQLRASAELPKLMIKPIPLAGRPPSFNGAIGKFSIATSAGPLKVPVGDPITLTLAIRGNVAMERVGAPRLDQVQTLTKDFEISGESLAGELKGNRKVFSQTIRALREDVAEIPPIPMSSFDPQTGQYKTVMSKAIPLQVLPAKRLTLAQASARGDGSPTTLRPLVETTDGLQANYANIEQMLVSRSEDLDTWVVALLAAMPVLFLVTWFMTQRSARFREDVALRRRHRAYAAAKKALRRVSHASRPEEAGVLVIGYIADRCNVPVAGLIRADAVKLLAERGVPPEMIDSLDGFLESLERAQYGGGAMASPDGAVDAAGNGSPGTIASEARGLLDAMERYDLR